MTGKAAYSTRGPILVGAVALLLLVGGLGLWSVTTRIAGAVVTSGQVEVEQNVQVVQHPDGGVVDQIRVANGDRVAAGDILVSLDGALLKTELTVVESQLFELMARRGRLEAERDGKPTIVYPAPLIEAAAKSPGLKELMDGQSSLFEARLASVEDETAQLRAQQGQTADRLSGLDAQRAAIERQLGLVGAELDDLGKLLDNQLVQAGRVLALQREEARLQGVLGEIAADRAETESAITLIEIEITKLGSQRREEANTQLRDIGFRELELAERQRSLREQIARLDIRAPVGGLIHDLRVTTPKSVIRPADPVLYIVPQDRPLRIAAPIATVNIDEVKVGQDVTLRLAAFNGRTTPELSGMVTNLSADALRDPNTQAPFYRAEIMLNDGELAKIADRPLIPGMPVEVFIKTGERTPLSYLMKPLTDYFNRAFRES